MIVLIDNYDSFSYNLYQLIGTLHPDIRVIRNDELSVSEVREPAPQPRHPLPRAGLPARRGHLCGGGETSLARRLKSWACAWGTRRSARPSARRSPTPSS